MVLDLVAGLSERLSRERSVLADLLAAAGIVGTRGEEERGREVFDRACYP
jgi:hypothetical protein